MLVEWSDPSNSLAVMRYHRNEYAELSFEVVKCWVNGYEVQIPAINSQVQTLMFLLGLYHRP